jgi:hypothetical protein
VTSWQTFEAIVATLCWGGIIAYVAFLGARNAWRRWPWRSRQPPDGEMLQAMLRRARRRAEQKELVELERKGAILWRPDPDKVRALSAQAASLERET